MGNTIKGQTGVREDDGGCGKLQSQVVSADHDQFQAGAEESAPNQRQPLSPHGGNGGEHDLGATSISPLKYCKTKSDTDIEASGRTDLPTAESLDDDPHHHASLLPLVHFGSFKPLTISATDGGAGSRTELPAAESLDNDPEDPSSSLPQGVQFVLNTLPVKARFVGDGDGFTAYVKSIEVPHEHGGLGQVAKMEDDSNNLEIPQRRCKIRMRGVDAPELKMQYGDESKNALVKLIGGKSVLIYVYEMDQYGRYVGDIYCDDIFVQEQMLKRGFAWHFETYDKRPEFARWQREAKAARRGFWSSHNPQKPWEWRRNQRNTKKENGDDIQVELPSQGNGSSETLPLLIKKDMENLGREWKKKLENIVADNMKLNDQLQEFKFYSKRVAALNMNLKDTLQELKKKNKMAEERDKESEKKMESVVAENMKLNDQLLESKKKKKEAEDRAMQLIFFSENVGAVNMDLHAKILELEKKNKNAEDRAKESEKKMESVAAVNMKLNDQLQESKKKKKNEMESVLTNNMKLEDQLQELNREKKLLENRVLELNMDLHDKLEELKNKNKKVENRACQPYLPLTSGPSSSGGPRTKKMGKHSTIKAQWVATGTGWQTRNINE